METTQNGKLTFGIEIEIHIPVLQAPEHDSVQERLGFPSDDWYKRNCLFYSSKDGRKIPVVRDDVKVSSEARRFVWDQLLVLFKETIERPASGCSAQDIEVVTAETEHPRATFEPLEATSSTLNMENNVLGNFIDGHFEVYEKWTVCKDESGCWYRGSDGSLFQEAKLPPVGPQRYSWFSIEIKSKVYEELSALEDGLKKVCERIRSRFLVSVNCGRKHNMSSVHVHVGRTGYWNPNYEPFNLVSAKKAATIMYLLEPALMEMHASWKSKNYRYAALLRGYTHLGELCTPSIDVNSPDLPIDAEMNPEDTAYEPNDFDLSRAQLGNMQLCLGMGMPPGRHKSSTELIWGANGLTQLAWLLSCREGSRRGALALHGLITTRKDVIKSRRLNTIEFRHMQGSLDVIDIMNWVRIVGKIMDKSVMYSDKAYEIMFAKLISLDRPCISEVANVLGLSLAVKPKEQIEQEYSLPEVPEEGDERGWKRMASLMFLPKASGPGAYLRLL
ncbi:uncharacterized protein F4822DRAFT_443001 [Hypoxylon trugodes]|uniref:uncharacterized protein n=1 Tax=Hypoxylon trugodes TaxID=326681 RepID=UPI00218EEA39|nr:uncharacterized protein F4822DRAFT_443001 [Hypoxylon trugodes]KAI1389941.1 hypothetical protein F4822DRAFT_443001 [Hypoxylon trugodes]